jgi:hypothetical protein
VHRCACGARGRAVGAGITLLVVIALAGCGSSSEGLAAKSAAQILAASRSAARNASAVHVTSEAFGTAIVIKTRAKRTRRISKLDLQLDREGVWARLVALGSTLEAIRIGDIIYVKGGPLLYRNLQRRTGVHVAPGTWLKAPANGPQLSGFAAFAEPSREIMGLLGDPTLSLTKGHTTTIKGQKAIELRTEGKLYSGAIYIAASGPPDPILIVKHGRETARTTFTGWNQPTQLTAPAGAVELPAVVGHSG